jgi:hypothetical protein
MSKPKPKPQVPGATPPATPPVVGPAPTFEQLQALKIDAIALHESQIVIRSQDELDALSDEDKAKLFAHYFRFKAAPPDPTPEQIQAGADQVTDVAIAMSKGAAPTAGQAEVDPTKIDRPVLTKDGWVCPAKPEALKS